MYNKTIFLLKLNRGGNELKVSIEKANRKDEHLNISQNKDLLELETIFRLYIQYNNMGLHFLAGQLLPRFFDFAYKTDNIKIFADFINQDILKLDKCNNSYKLISNDISPLLTKERKKPVILLHIYGWLYGGMERVISLLSNHLITNYHIVITAFPPIENSDFRLDKNIVFIPLMGDYHSDGMTRLIKLVHLLRPDVFVGNNNSIPGYADIYKTLDQNNIKTIALCHEYYFFPHNHPFLLNYAIDKNKSLSAASAVSFPTNFSAATYGLTNDNAIIMPYPNTFSTNTNNYFNPDRKNVISIGRFDDSIKRLDRMLIAFSKVLHTHPDAKLLLVGRYDLSKKIPDSSEKTVEELIDDLSIPSENIEFAGLVDDVSSYYKKGDIFLLTSDNEGFPLTLNEAGANGLPCVIVDIPGLEDIIADGENGFIVPGDDHDCFANKISLLLSDTQLRKQMSEKAAQMTSRFDISDIGTKWEKLLDILLNEDSQEDINNKLKATFPAVIKDEKVLCKRVMKEYINYGIAASKKL